MIAIDELSITPKVAWQPSSQRLQSELRTFAACTLGRKFAAYG